MYNVLLLFSKSNICHCHLQYKIATLYLEIYLPLRQWPWADLELRSKPELYDGVLVTLAPHVEDTEDHGVHQQLKQHTKSYCNIHISMHLILLIRKWCWQWSLNVKERPHVWPVCSQNLIKQRIMHSLILRQQFVNLFWECTEFVATIKI